MNPITFDEWGAQEANLLWATENGGNASQVIQYLEQNHALIRPQGNRQCALDIHNHHQ